MSSVARPRSSDTAKVIQACHENGVDYIEIHIMAAGTLSGVPAIICTEGSLLDPKWLDIFYEIFITEKSVVEEYDSFDVHDSLTNDTQGRWMILSLLNSLVPSKRDLGEVMRYGGPSTRLIGLGMWRHYMQIEVVAETITQHPDGPEFVRDLRKAVRDVSRIIDEQDFEAAVQSMKRYVERIDAEDLELIRFQSDWLSQQLSDLNGNAVVIEFSSEVNRLGLGSAVLGVFDECGEDKTTTTIQTNPRLGTALFLIGVKDLNSRGVKKAKRLVKERFGGRPRRVGFQIL
jgi:hypothetical protein